MVISAYLLIVNNRHAHKWPKTKGKIIHLEYTGGNIGTQGAHRPIVQYIDWQNQERVAESYAGSSGYKIGDRIDIFYNPEEPTEILAADALSISVVPVLFFIIGLMLTFLAFSRIVHLHILD